MVARPGTRTQRFWQSAHTAMLSYTKPLCPRRYKINGATTPWHPWRLSLDHCSASADSPPPQRFPIAYSSAHAALGTGRRHSGGASLGSHNASNSPHRVSPHHMSPHTGSKALPWLVLHLSHERVTRRPKSRRAPPQGASEPQPNQLVSDKPTAFTRGTSGRADGRQRRGRDGGLAVPTGEPVAVEEGEGEALAAQRGGALDLARLYQLAPYAAAAGCHLRGGLAHLRSRTQSMISLPTDPCNGPLYASVKQQLWVIQLPAGQLNTPSAQC